MDAALALIRMGYRVDSSVTAFESWEQYNGPDYSRVPPRSFVWPGQSGDAEPLVEVPATVGFAQRSFELCNKIWHSLSGSLGRSLHAKGILSRLGLLNKIWLSPETASSNEMIRLTKIMMRENYEVVNLFFHSTALLAGLSPFVQTKEQEGEFLGKMAGYLSFAIETGLESVTLSEFARLRESGLA